MIIIKMLTFCGPPQARIFLAGILISLWSLSQASGDAIRWEPYRATLAKPEFSPATAKRVWHSESGANRVTMTLAHDGTSRNLFTYSKWEIDRWGDPEGKDAEEGAWQVVSNEANEVVLGVWGYWGWDGGSGSPRAQPGDRSSYVLTLEFDRPVTRFRLPVHGINALMAENRFHAVDRLLVEAFAEDGSPRGVGWTDLGEGIEIASSGGVLGRREVPVGMEDNTFDQGSAVIVVEESLQRLVLRFSNEAVEPEEGAFVEDAQPWSFSLGGMVFENEVSVGQPTSVEWFGRKGRLRKPGYDRERATSTVLSKDGRVQVRLALEHVATTPGLTTFSKWEIDHWGDPDGVAYEKGSWQVVSNGLNDVVLGMWGYWGAEGETVTEGDFTSYRLTLAFSQPVRRLVMPLIGINGVISEAKGFYSQDLVTVEGYEGERLRTPTIRQAGPAMRVVEGRLEGNYGHQIDDGISGQHMSDDGAAEFFFGEAVDRVVVTLRNIAGRENVNPFAGGLQTWSFSVGDLRFTYDSDDLGNLARLPGVVVTQSSTLAGHLGPERLVDGQPNGNLWDGSVGHTEFSDNPWITIDLGEVREIGELVLWGRTDALAEPTEDLVVFLSSEPFTDEDPALTQARQGVLHWDPGNFSEGLWRLSVEASGRYLRVQRRGTGSLSLAEIEVLGDRSQSPSAPAPLGAVEPANDPNAPAAHPYLDQLGIFALVTATYPAGIGVEASEAGVDVLFERPPGIERWVRYILEVRTGREEWQSFPVEASALTGLRLPRVDALVPEGNLRGQARLRIEVPVTGAVTWTSAVGWDRTEWSAGYQTHGLWLMRAPIAVGRVAQAGPGLVAEIEMTEGTDVRSPEVLGACLEVVEGEWAGHRWKVESLTELASGGWRIQGAAEGEGTIEDLSGLPPGTAVVMYPYWTLDAAYPPMSMQADRDLTRATQVLFLKAGGYETYFNLARPDGSVQWVNWDDRVLNDRGETLLLPGEGVFLWQPEEVPGSRWVVGHVRQHRFRRPLVEGAQLVSAGFPQSTSLREWRMTAAAGWVSGQDPILADRLHLWEGDQNPPEARFYSLFYFQPPGRGPAASYWVGAEDETLTPQDDTPLLPANRAVLVERSRALPGFFIDP